MGRRGGLGQKRARMNRQRQGMMNLRKTNRELRGQMNQQSSGPTTGTTASQDSPMNMSNRR
jgi:hypothetical protein